MKPILRPMNRRSLLAALLILCSAGTVVCSSAKETLGALKEGERLEVWYGTSGCFHLNKHFLVFKGRSVAVSVVGEDGAGGMKKTLIGELELTAEELKELDETFERYREKPEYFSTSTESLSVEVWSGEKQVSKEVIAEHRAAGGGNGEKGLQLWQLVERAEKK